MSRIEVWRRGHNAPQFLAVAWSAGGLVLIVSLAGACTESNPAYVAEAGGRVGDGATADLQSGRRDHGPSVRDGGPARDGSADGRTRPPDAKIRPDVVPPVCTKGSDCDDKRSCTRDRCVANKCVNTVASGSCLIGATCYSAGQSRASNSCQYCAPATSQTAWSKRTDGASCRSDKLSCTADRCKAGSCTHVVSSGCLVGGHCYQAGAAISGKTCERCQPKQSRSSSTFVSGQLCKRGSSDGICAAKACRLFSSSSFEPSQVSSLTATYLTSVDYIPAAKQVWAVGRFDTRSSSRRGLLVRLDTSSRTATLVRYTLADVSHRMAVGRNGRAFVYEQGGWKRDSTVERALSGSSRYGVWGVPLAGGAEAFFLVGRQTLFGGAHAVVRCDARSGSFSCANHYGVDAGATLAPVGGALSSSGQPLVWTARVETLTDHIYYYRGTSVFWTRASPYGCTDGFGTACSNSAGDLRSVYFGSRTDGWAAGENGTLLHFDGSGWKRITLPFSGASNYMLDAVFSDASERLTLVVGHIDLSSYRRVVAFTHSGVLDKWYGPVTIGTTSGSLSSRGRLLHAGGKDFAGLWLVGYRSSSGRNRGWIVQLK